MLRKTRRAIRPKIPAALVRNSKADGKGLVMVAYSNSMISLRPSNHGYPLKGALFFWSKTDALYDERSAQGLNNVIGIRCLKRQMPPRLPPKPQKPSTQNLGLATFSQPMLGYLCQIHFVNNTIPICVTFRFIF